MNNIARNKISLGKLLEFEVLFPNEDIKTPHEYLSGGNQDIILQVASFFLGFKAHNSKYSNNIELLKAMFCEENKDFALYIHRYISESEKKGEIIGIVNPYSSLTLFETFFASPITGNTQSPAEFERNLFKAYLAINSSLTKLQMKALENKDTVDETLYPAMFLFTSQYPLSDKNSFDLSEVWVTQIIKATYLFQFLSSRPDTQKLLASFLEYFNVGTWQDYLKKLLPLTVTILTAEKEAHIDITVPFSASFNADCEFLEKLVVLNDDEELTEDFKTLRSKPFYKIEEGRYRVIFSLFVVEKVYKGLYFLLKEANDKLPEPDKKKELKSFLGNEFSEKYLLYKTIEPLFPNSAIKLSGADFETFPIDGGPDYYVRKGKDIFLFESKDFLIKADKKLSFDFDIYQDEFERILYFENTKKGKQKHKGVMQLINCIKKVILKEYGIDTNYNYKQVKIYPVLVVHDHQYSVPGFNSLLDYWFQAELELLQKEGLFTARVQPLVVINIDSLIFHQMGLSAKCSLKEVLDLYIRNSTRKLSLKNIYYEEAIKRNMEKYIPFSYFIDSLFRRKGLYEPPPLMEVVSTALFSENN